MAGVSIMGPKRRCRGGVGAVWRRCGGGVGAVERRCGGGKGSGPGP